MSSEKRSPPNFSLVIGCQTAEERADVSKLLVQYRSAMNVCFREELGTECQMSDGEIVKECLLDGLRVTRKAIGIVRSTSSKRT